MKSEIRKATKKDLKSIAEIFRIESAKKPYSQEWTSETAFKKIFNCFKKDLIHVAIINKKIIGFINSRINPDGEAYIDEFWISLNYQGKGVGTALLKFVEGEYKNNRVKSIKLVANKKAKALHFYKKLKYKEKQILAVMKKQLK